MDWRCIRSCLHTHVWQEVQRSQTHSFKWTLSWTGLFINISNQTFEPCVPPSHHSPQTKLINSTSDTHQNQRRRSKSASQNVIQWCFMQRGSALIRLPGREVCGTIRKLEVYLISAQELIALEDQWGTPTMACFNQLAIYSRAILLQLIT